MRAFCVLMAATLGITGCGGEDDPTPAPGAPDAGAPDAGRADGGGARDCMFPSGRTCLAGAICAHDDACNSCECLDGELRCTLAFCDQPPGSLPTDCTSNSDCGDGFCILEQGCAAPRGRCVQVQCAGAMSSDHAEYCGCNDVAFTALCPDLPYEKLGPC